MELSERKLKILQVLVSEFIQNAEPVGSRALCKRYSLGISPATIRNEMADLEELGFLTHPHTSAGRIPSEKAYRLYVDTMMDDYELAPDAKKKISEQLMSNFSELDKTIQRATELLSEITNLTSFAITPRKDQDTLKYIDLFMLDDKRVMLMIASSSGKVSDVCINIGKTCTDENLELLAKSMTYQYRGKRITEVLKSDIVNSFKSDVKSLSALTDTIAPKFIETLEDLLNVDLFMGGFKNIFDTPEYMDIEKARNLLNMLDKKDELAKILTMRDNGVIITIGNENIQDDMRDYSLISATYHVDGVEVGKIGVIGPTRMEYNRVKSVVEYITDNLSRAFMLEERRDESDGEHKKG